MQRALSALLMLFLVLPALRPVTAASGPAVRGTGGAIASGDRYATEAGLAILASGGNAVDAAVASALVLAVTFPEAGNLGGGGFAVVKMGDEITALDFREVAPAGATREMFVDGEGVPVPGKSLIGPLAAGVPGSPSGLHALHQRHGVLPWKQVVDPARRLALEGFIVSRHLHDSLEGDRDLLSRFPETVAVWLPGGAPPSVGSTFRLPELAASLAAYAERGPVAITTGAVAAAIEEVSSRHGGVLTAADLAAYEPQWRTPVRFTGFGWEIAAMPLPSSGGAIIGETIGLIERLGWREKPRFGADRAHLLVESWRRAYADRFRMGDPATAETSPDDVLAAPWLDHQAAAILPESAAVSVELEPHPGVMTGEPAGALRHEPLDTTHLSVVDDAGNLVSLTTTINGLYGCGLYVPGAGFFLNNEMDDFAAAPGRPNLFGLIQDETNAVRPGKRMLSSMSPTIAWRGGDRDGSEALALGGRGGSLIPTNTMQVLLNVIVDGDELQEAINRPRLHHQWLPDKVRAEADTLSPETRAVLEARGHTIEISRATAKIQAVRRNADGTVEAAAEVRGPGAAGVVRPLEGVGLGDRRAVPPPVVTAPAPPP